MMAKIKFIFFLLFPLIFNLSCSTSEKIYIEKNDKSNYYAEVLKPLMEGNYIVLTDVNSSTNFLIKNIETLNILIALTKENILYAHYIDIANHGEPYRRKYIEFKSKDMVTVNEDKKTRSEYDPSNPFAKDDGYVDYPNIVLPIEKELLEYYIRLNNYFIDILEIKVKNYHFPKY